MSIMNTKMAAPVQFTGVKIDVNKGEDITPVLRQKFDDVILRQRFQNDSKEEHVLLAECGFDIETTKTEKGSFMYKWQMTFGNFLISGRTWEQWYAVMEKIEEHYTLGTVKIKRGRKTKTITKTCIMWIQNEGYEFQFFHKNTYKGVHILQKDDKDDSYAVFADGLRRPIKCNLSFRQLSSSAAWTVLDSGKFSPSLNQLAKDYGKTRKKKTVLPDGTVISDLDYDKPRNSLTPLTDEEEGYCDADVAILYEWAHFYNETYLKGNCFMPMTSTAIIRKAVQESFDNVALADPNIASELVNMFPTMPEYIELVNDIYRGGFTYGSREKAGKALHNVRGMDFTSSYPAVLLQCEYPMGKGTMDNTVTTEDDLCKYPNETWSATFEFTEIIETRGISVESLYKTHEYEKHNGNMSKVIADTGCVVDNGKLAYARKITVSLTDLDYDTYKKFYKWDSVKITKFRHYKKGFLPKWFTEVIMHYYKKKAYLKANGLDGTTEYVLSKAVVNGLYGLTVQKIHFDSVKMTENGWKKDTKTIMNPDDQLDMQKIYEDNMGIAEKTLARHMGIPKVVLSPYWGVWCTAHARHRILEAIYELGDDFVYCDTDSVYMINYDKHSDWFDAWNNNIHAWNDVNLVEPEFHTIGDFDAVKLEGELGDTKGPKEYSFMTLGAKRYIKWTEDDIHVTVAGLPHKAMCKRAKSKVGDKKEDIVNWIVDHFDDGLTIAAEEAMKNAHAYMDDPVDDLVIDEFGNASYMHEEACISIYPIEFTLKVDPIYKRFFGMNVNEMILTGMYRKLVEEEKTERRIS